MEKVRPANANGDARRAGAAQDTCHSPRRTSLSMQWEKLERSYQALEALLRLLQPTDRFSLLLFNNQTQAFQPVSCVR